VQNILDENADVTAAAGKAPVFISESSKSSKIPTSIATTGPPIVTAESAVLDELGMTDDSWNGKLRNVLIRSCAFIHPNLSRSR